MVDDLDKVCLPVRDFGPEANVLSSIEQYTIIIAASIPIIVPALRWMREKLSYYRYVIASWTGFNNEKKTSKGKDSPEEQQDGIV